MCTDDDRKECEEEIGTGPNLEWACENCPKKPAEDLHPYTLKLLQLRTLKKAGYPMEANDLQYEEWLDLGRVCQALDMGCPFMGSDDGQHTTEDGK